MRQIRIRQADLYYRIGRWHYAATQFHQLATDPLVQQQPYLLAQAELGLARTLLHRNPRTAAALLQRSQAALEQIGDLNLVGLAAILLATLEAQRHNRPAARRHWQQAAIAYYRANNLLDSTAARLAGSPIDGILASSKAPAPADDLPLRAYIARFPQRLQQIFQQVALFVALPLTYLFAGALVDNLSLLARRSEVLVQALANYTEQASVVVDVLVALPYLLATPLLLIWLYELLYLLVGLLLIRFLPLAWLTREQPCYLLTDANGCTLYDAQGEVQCTLLWRTVTFTASLNRRLWQLPFHLFSRFVVGNEAQVITVEGITSHYTALQQAILETVHGAQRRDGQPPAAPRHFNLDYVLLARPWFLATLLLTTLLALIAFFNVLGPDASGWNYLYIQPPSGPVYLLYLSSLLWWFLHWFVITGPLLALLHLWYNQRRITTTLGGTAIPLYRWPVRITLLIFLGLLLIELALLRL